MLYHRAVITVRQTGELSTIVVELASRPSKPWASLAHIHIDQWQLSDYLLSATERSQKSESPWYGHSEIQSVSDISSSDLFLRSTADKRALSEAYKIHHQNTAQSKLQSCGSTRRPKLTHWQQTSERRKRCAVEEPQAGRPSTFSSSSHHTTLSSRCQFRLKVRRRTQHHLDVNMRKMWVCHILMVLGMHEGGVHGMCSSCGRDFGCNANFAWRAFQRRECRLFAPTA